MYDRAIPSTGEHGSRRETLQRTTRATRTHRTTSPAPRIPAARTASRWRMAGPSPAVRTPTSRGVDQRV